MVSVAAVVLFVAVAALVLYLRRAARNGRQGQGGARGGLVQSGRSYAEAARRAAANRPSDDGVAAAGPDPSTSAPPNTAVMDKTEWSKFPLIKKTEISSNTAIYRFKLPAPTDTLGLPIGQHISIMAEIDGKQVMRSYTPISSASEKGYFDLLIKWYPTGNISKHINQLRLGASVNVRGPKGAFCYEPNMAGALGMIAGGTGITPMLQVIEAVLANAAVDKTQLRLIFANVRYQDILLKQRLDSLAQQHPDQFRVFYVLNDPPSESIEVARVNPSDYPWTQGVGFVTADMIKAHLPAAADNVKLLLCGPPPMIKAMSAHAESLGFEAPRVVSRATDQVFKF